MMRLLSRMQKRGDPQGYYRSHSSHQKSQPIAAFRDPRRRRRLLSRQSLSHLSLSWPHGPGTRRQLVFDYVARRKTSKSQANRKERTLDREKLIGIITFKFVDNEFLLRDYTFEQIADRVGCQASRSSRGAIAERELNRASRECSVVGPGLQASHETGHDDDGQDLHRPLRANGKKVIAHHPADLGKVGIGSAQLDTNPQISRQQVAEALDRH